MTICISVKVHDCLVFAADSASSIIATDPNGKQVVVKIFNHGNKVFNIYKGLPVVAMTCGMGNIGEASISTLAKDFRSLAKDNSSKYYIDPQKYSIKEFADKAFDFFFNEKYQGLKTKPTGDHTFEFWIGGYGAGGSQSEVWKVHIASGKCKGPEEVQGGAGLGLSAAGQPEAFNRLVVGYGSSMSAGLQAAGIAAKDVPNALAEIKKKTQANLAYASMPIQDAIRLADFLVDTTKGYVSFVPGADTVGGDTDIAVVTKHEGFKWVRRKHYYNTQLNPLETDHA
ncbi:MAG: hypothetical protein J0H65_03410 [Rhizobiales bacterium]|nr:hypothetical protein [Hyphomicrobiales bacterium]